MVVSISVMNIGPCAGNTGHKSRVSNNGPKALDVCFV